jgi:hypothetical protein
MRKSPTPIEEVRYEKREVKNVVIHWTQFDLHSEGSHHDV